MKGRAGGAFLSPPSKEEGDRLLEAIRQEVTLSTLKPQMESLVSKHRGYAAATGDSFFLVRTFANLGMRLIRHGTDARVERARIAQGLAQEALQWEPRNVFAWSLWREALVEEGALEAAELVCWEWVRRVPDDPQPRVQLADLLAKESARRDVAEALFRETIQRFPDNPYARNQLAELLIATDRVAEAEAVVAVAFASGAFNAVTYAIQARLSSHAGDDAGARRAVVEGLGLENRGAVLRRFESLLNAGRALPLVSRAFDAQEEVVAGPATVARPADPFLASALARGRARRLRFQLDSANDELRAKARAEVESWLRSEPAFAYAELLAARQRIWDAETTALPPVAVAFEDALAAEDRQRLEALAKRVPRLDALILVARAVLGDTEAALQVERWLRAEPDRAEEPAVAALRSLMRPVLRVIEGGVPAPQAIAENRTSVIHALHDANEATLGDALLAA